MFNNFFTNVGIKLTKDITVHPNHNFKKLFTKRTWWIFWFKSLSELEINNTIDKLDIKKSYSFDGISNVLFNQL